MVHELSKKIKNTAKLKKKISDSIPLIILTPYKGPRKIIFNTVRSISLQLKKKDKWIIALDNEKIQDYYYLKKKYKKLILLNYLGPSGAGYSRNFGLDYISKNVRGQFLLFPLDGDDRIVNNGVELIKRTMQTSPFNIVSFAHCKIWPNGKKKVIKYSGVFSLSDLLKKYITPCGSTVLRISNSKVFKYLKFSNRFRANDALFFYRAVKYFSKFECKPEILLKYKVGNTLSLSGKKYKMLYYKFLALKDFNVGKVRLIIYLIFYIYYGIRRYYFKRSA